MLQRIRHKLNEIDHYYIPIKNNECASKIYELYFNDMYFEPVNGIEHLYFAIYFRYFKGNDVKAKYNYDMAISYNHIDSYNCLARYYEDNNNNIQAKVNYKLGIKAGDLLSLINLGIHYNEEENSFTKSKKYFLMAIRRNSTDAMKYYGYYCIRNGKYKIGERQLLKAIKYNDNDDWALNCLGCYYKDIHNNNQLARRYWLKASSKDNIYSIYNLAMLYKEEQNYITMRMYLSLYLIAFNN
jgi:hypothetical protein